MNKLKAAYTIRELSELTGISRWTIWRMVGREGIRKVGTGKGSLIPLSEFVRAFPEVWDSLRVAMHLDPTTQVECASCGHVTTINKLRRA